MHNPIFFSKHSPLKYIQEYVSSTNWTPLIQKKGEVTKFDGQWIWEDLGEG